jgi:hypothetical protein
MAKTYKEQSEEIKVLAERIVRKSIGFAVQTKDSPYYEDLDYVINELKSVDEFLNDKYLK